MATAPLTYAIHSLVTFGGTLGSGSTAEVWQCGVKVAQYSGPSSSGPGQEITDLAQYLAAINGGVLSWFTGPGNLMRNDATLTFLKVANIGTNGKYDGTHDFVGNVNPQVATYTSANVGPTAPSGPPFVTVAVSWRNSTAVKDGRNGRIYPPFAINLASGSSRIASATQTTLMNIGKSLLTTLSKDGLALATGGTVSVRPVCAGRGSTIGRVDTVRVGDVLDVQRRRKNKLRESYVQSAWS